MSTEVTEEQLKKLAHDMVAAGNLNALYGIDPFIRAQTLFELALHEFAGQITKNRPPSEVADSVLFENYVVPIPEFLRFNP